MGRTIEDVKSELEQVVDVIESYERRQYIQRHHKTLHELCSFFEIRSYLGLPFEARLSTSVDMEKVKRRLREERISFSVNPEPAVSESENLGLHEVNIAPEVFGIYYDPLYPMTSEDLLAGRVPSNFNIFYSFTLDGTPTAFLRGPCYNTIYSNRQEAERILRIVKQSCEELK